MPHDHIKSAWELALEKTQKLGKMSPEELEGQRRKERAAIGRSLVHKYFENLPLRDIQLTFDRHPEKEREDIRKAVISEFLHEVNLSKLDRASKAAEGLAGVVTEPEAKVVANGLQALLEEYAQAVEDRWQESRARVEERLRKSLEDEGIGGPAVEPNMESQDLKRAAISELLPTYANRLYDLKEKLARINKVG
ncbi:MAG: hypothetical protein HYX87_04365 [Chloroflexi bacterium]|nr:hypothetical protein [Chloroflexota bacterium]